MARYSSLWSKINKQKAERLIAQGLMTRAGMESIERAKQNGAWTMLDDVEELTVPPDLKQALGARRGAEDYFLSLSRSTRKAMLQWLALARRPATRQQRIDDIATLAAQQLKPKQFS